MLLMGVVLHAAPVTQQQALERAVQFLSKRSHGTPSKGMRLAKQQPVLNGTLSILHSDLYRAGVYLIALIELIEPACRAQMLAAREGCECGAISARSEYILLPTYFVREIYGVAYAMLGGTKTYRVL